MSFYSDFKKCLIDAWPNGTVFRAAICVAIDCRDRLPIAIRDKTIGGFLQLSFSQDDFDKLVSGINMPTCSLLSLITVYLSDFYPATSAMLFDGISKDVCYKHFLKEKKSRRSFVTRGSLNEARSNFGKSAGYKLIRLRELSKKHDWNTIK